MGRFSVLNFLFLYATAVAVLPVLAIPGALVGTDLQKGMLAAVILGIVCGGVGVSLALFRQTISIPRTSLLLAVFFLLGSVSISAFFGASWRMSVWGEGIEVGTVASFVLFAAAVCAGLIVTERRAVVILRVFVGATTLAAVISAILHVWMPDVLRGATLAGAWEQLSFLIGAAILIALTFLYRETGRSLRAWNGAATLVLTICFFLYFIPATAVLLALSLGLVIVGSYIASWCISGMVSPRTLLAGALVSLAFLLCTFVVERPIFDLPSSVRPSSLASELVVAPVFLDNLRQTFFGAGPNTFPAVWERYRPGEFNTTPYWNVTPPTGFSTFFTFAATLGIFGVLLYLWCFAVPFIEMGMRVFHSEVSTYALVPDSFTASLALVLYALGSFFLFPVSMPLFLLGGIAIGFLVRSLPEQSFFSLDISSVFIRYPLAIALLFASLFLISVPLRQFTAATYHTRGTALLETKNYTAAVPLLVRAAEIWSISEYERDASRAVITLTFTRANEQAVGSGVAGLAEGDTEALRSGISHAVSLSDLAAASGSDDYETWIARAELFINLIPTGFPDAANSAQIAVNQAGRLSPNRPEVPYLWGVLAANLGNGAEARAKVAHALELKPDYAPALELKKQLEQ